ncbi:MAG: primosomal protein DnaI [Bacilli bacterium]
MDHMGKQMEKFVRGGDFQAQLAKVQERLLANEDVRAWVHANRSQVDEAMFQRSLANVQEFIEQKAHCNACPGLANCRNLVQGYAPSLQISGRTIDVGYTACALKIQHDQSQRLRKLISCIHVPREIQEAKFPDAFLDDPDRFEVIQATKQYADALVSGEKVQGLYLYGKFGVGKTFLLGCIANRLAEHGLASTIVYVPEFVRSMKSAISDGSLEEKIREIQSVPMLMLDDIGAETVSPWVRDDILGPIFQYRMQERLATCFTSNFDLTELEKHYAHSSRGDVETVKAVRIMERIRHLSRPIEARGSNLRA